MPCTRHCSRPFVKCVRPPPAPQWLWRQGRRTSRSAQERGPHTLQGTLPSPAFSLRIVTTARFWPPAAWCVGGEVFVCLCVHVQSQRTRQWGAGRGHPQVCQAVVLRLLWRVRGSQILRPILSGSGKRRGCPVSFKALFLSDAQDTHWPRLTQYQVQPVGQGGGVTVVCVWASSCLAVPHPALAPSVVMASSNLRFPPPPTLLHPPCPPGARSTSPPLYVCATSWTAVTTSPGWGSELR